ncbi:MAG TPA: ABC transporter permease [Cellulomonas sp.]
MRTRMRAVLPPLLSIVGLLVIWQTAVVLLDVPKFILPAPTAIAQALVDERDVIGRNVGVTLLELALGYGLGVGAGLLLAIVMNFARPLKSALYPLLVASQTIPKVAIAPLFVLWFGVGLLPKVLIIALLAFFPVLINTISGLDATDRGHIELFASVNSSRWDLYRHVKIPAAVPHLFAGLKLALTVSVIGAVIAEFVASSSGLGYLLLAYNSSLRTTELFATLVVLIVISGLAFVAIVLLERLVSWQARDRGGDDAGSTLPPVTGQIA